MKKMLLVVATVIATMLAQTVMAQPKQASDEEKAMREQMMQTRIQMLNEELKLTPEQLAKFDPLYREFRKELSKVTDSSANVKRENLNNDNAIKVLSARLANQINTTSVKQKYLLNFAEVIEPMQIEKLYRIDDKVGKEARKVMQYRNK